MRRYAGGCHCGALALVFETERDPAEIAVRACQCSFCRKHATRAITDPGGRITLGLIVPGAVSRYSFGLGTADYYLCARCGVYVAAVARAEPPTAIAILNALDEAGAFVAPPRPTVYDHETADMRRDRRARSWTPARILGAVDFSSFRKGGAAL